MSKTKAAPKKATKKVAKSAAPKNAAPAAGGRDDLARLANAIKLTAEALAGFTGLPSDEQARVDAAVAAARDL